MLGELSEQRVLPVFSHLSATSGEPEHSENRREQPAVEKRAVEEKWGVRLPG